MTACLPRMPDCIFCKIVAGEIPATKVYEDERTLSFLDISPLRPGHTLVIPKIHGARLAELSEEDALALMKTTQRLSPVVSSTVDAPDALLAIHDGPAAGQEVPHLHLHIVPRKDGDGGGPVHALFRERMGTSHEEIAALGEEMRRRLERS